MLAIRCPKCKSTGIRPSLAQSGWEQLARFCGVLPLRCRDCDCRFTNSIWDFANLIYARCPQCYRLELSEWNPQKYNTPSLWKARLALGAKAMRCEACRVNFVSFRPCKVRYVRRKVVGQRATSTTTDLGPAS